MNEKTKEVVTGSLLGIYLAIMSLLVLTNLIYILTSNQELAFKNSVIFLIGSGYGLLYILINKNIGGKIE